MKNLIFLFSIMSLSFSCSDSNDDTPDNGMSGTFPADVNSTLISKGGLQGDSQDLIPETNMVIYTNAEWQQLMDQMNLENIYEEPYTETNIDFSQYMVLAVFDQTRPHSGYWINIGDVTEQQDSIFVEVTRGSEVNGFDVMNRPFYIVKIPKTQKPIAFQ